MMTAAAALLAATLLAVPPPARSVEAPEWLETALGAPPDPVTARSPVVQLLQQQWLDVSRTATRARVREAFRILTTQGSGPSPLKAAQRLGQDFRLLGGWIVRPDRSVSRFDAKSILQIDADDSYESTTSKINILPSQGVRAGDTIAWEYELRAGSEAYVCSWSFGWTWPTLVSRFGLKLPEGWSQRSLMRNHEEVRPSLDHDGYLVWELRDLPAIHEEPMSPSTADLVPTLVVSYGPASGGGDRRRFDTWQSVGKWYAGLVAEQTVADDAIKEAVSRAVGGAAPGLDSIRAVTRFVQSVRYLNIALGRSTAEPHPAGRTLKNRFGDCEDKSVLAITMLRQIGVPAFPVQARTSALGDLVTEFPAPTQFNHVIVAIRAPDGEGLPSAIEGGSLGRLVVFDPTDALSGLGDLSPSLQGTKGVISDLADGGLVTLPVLPPEASSRDSEVSVSFAPSGGIEVKARYTYTGQYAAAERWHYGSVRGDKRREEIIALLASQFGAAELNGLEVRGVENPDEPLVLAMDLTMKLPGRDLGSMRTMAAQFLLGSRAKALGEAGRTTPFRIEGGYRETERTTVALPEGWRAALPLPAAAASSAVGDYRLAARAEAAKLFLDRSLTVKASTIAPADYAPIRQFFDEIARGDALAVAFERIAR